MQKILVLMTLALPALITCGGGGGGTIAIEDLDTEFLNKGCDAQVRCGHFPDRAACLQATSIDLDQIRASVAAGRIDYDSDVASACLEASVESSCDRIPEEGEDDDAICDDLLTGTVAIGGACFVDAECPRYATCDGKDTATCMQGTCVAVPVADLGESCAAAACVSGANCSDNICVARPPAPTVGQSCDSPFACNGSLCISGTCVALPGTGEACDPDFGGFGGILSCGDWTEFCDFTDSTCKPRLALGEECPASPGDACVGYAACDSGTCVAAPTLGDACGETTPRCLGNLDCTGGTCVTEPKDPVCTI